MRTAIRGNGRSRQRTDAGIVAALVMSCACVGCADNATSLSSTLAKAAARLNSNEAHSPLTTSYEPITGSVSPYTVILFPDRRVDETDVVAAGVDKEIAHRIYSELAYLGSMANVLVVEQEGERLAFTTSWSRVAEVQGLVVSPRKIGTAEIVLTRENGTTRVVAIR